VIGIGLMLLKSGHRAHRGPFAVEVPEIVPVASKTEHRPLLQGLPCIALLLLVSSIPVAASKASSNRQPWTVARAAHPIRSCILGQSARLALVGAVADGILQRGASMLRMISSDFHHFADERRHRRGVDIASRRWAYQTRSW
jgi:hypothetical protein